MSGPIGFKVVKVTAPKEELGLLLRRLISNSRILVSREKKRALN